MRTIFSATFVALLIHVAACNMCGAHAIDQAAQEGRESATCTDIRAIRQVVTLFMVQNNNRCPSSVAELTERRLLDASARTADAWGTEFSIRCQDEEPIVISAGRDRRFGTDDDLRCEETP